jgi:hypothetical protein
MLNVVLFQTFPSHFGEVDGPMSMDPHVGIRLSSVVRILLGFDQ